MNVVGSGLSAGSTAKATISFDTDSTKGIEAGFRHVRKVISKHGLKRHEIFYMLEHGSNNSFDI